MKTLEQVLADVVEKSRTPSVQYYLFDQKDILKSFHLGFANIARRQEVDSNATYNAFSVTKTFTALAILQLAEQGRVNISDPMIRYLPVFPFGSEITVKQVLSHSAGIPNPVPLSWIHLDTEHKTFDRNSFFESAYAKSSKVKFRPNEKFAYSNLGYVLLGQLIEHITGKTYEEYVTENILRKLSLNANDLSFLNTDSFGHATGYHKRMSVSNIVLGFFIDKSKFMGEAEGRWKPFKTFYVNGASYGGLIGKPASFVKYIQELLKDDGSLISAEYRQLLFQENRTNDGRNTGMCLSWFSGQLDGNIYFAHAGGGGGYYCEIRIYSGLKIGSVVFFNRTGMSDERYLDKLDRFYLGGQMTSVKIGND